MLKVKKEELIDNIVTDGFVVFYCSREFPFFIVMAIKALSDVDFANIYIKKNGKLINNKTFYLY